MGLDEIFDRLKDSVNNEKISDAVDTIRQSYEKSKGSCKVVTYSKDDRSIAKGGMDGINEVLFCNDKAKIRSLLFCLDYYLDPYYKSPLPYADELCVSLQKLLIQTRDDDIIDDICDLLSYGYDCSIVRDNLDDLKQDRLSDIRNILEI